MSVALAVADRARRLHAWLLRVHDAADGEKGHANGQANTAVLTVGGLAAAVSQVGADIPPHVLRVVLLAGYPAAATIACAMMVWVPRGLGRARRRREGALLPGSWPHALTAASASALVADYESWLPREHQATAHDLIALSRLVARKFAWARAALLCMGATVLVLLAALSVGLHHLWQAAPR